MNKFEREYRKWRFSRSARKILSTPTLIDIGNDKILLSLVCKRDLNRYLISIKSVYYKIGGGEIVILNDGTLGRDQKELIVSHLGNVRFFELPDIDLGSCPDYICWSRLLLILELSKEKYVVQVDSDIVAIESLDEVTEAIRKNEPFIIVNKTHPGRMSLADMSDWIKQKGWGQETVQVLAEKAFRDMPDATSRYYIRGSAAFVGFPKGNNMRSEVEKFSSEIEKLVGPIWRTWGSEQTATNYVLGNLDNTNFMEYPKYVNNMPSLSLDEAKLVHFFGTYRYIEDRYADFSERAMKLLIEEGASLKNRAAVP